MFIQRSGRDLGLENLTKFRELSRDDAKSLLSIVPVTMPGVVLALHVEDSRFELLLLAVLIGRAAIVDG